MSSFRLLPWESNVVTYRFMGSDKCMVPFIDTMKKQAANAAIAVAQSCTYTVKAAWGVKKNSNLMSKEKKKKHNLLLLWTAVGLTWLQPGFSNVEYQRPNRRGLQTSGLIIQKRVLDDDSAKRSSAPQKKNRKTKNKTFL